MKTMSKILAGSALFLLSACLQGGELDAASPVVDPGEVRTLSTPEGAAPASEYSARMVTLRLFGVQPAEGPSQAFATLADTSSWATSNYKVGDPVGRNLTVSAVHDDSIEITEAGQVRRLPVGADLKVRVVLHAFDLAAQDQGQHVWSINAGTLRRIQARYGVGTTGTPVTIADRTVIRLGAVAAGSVFDRLGFHEGDRIYAVDGQAAQAADLDRVAHRLSTPESGGVVLTVGHGHSVWDASYVVR